MDRTTAACAILAATALILLITASRAGAAKEIDLNQLNNVEDGRLIKTSGNVRSVTQSGRHVKILVCKKECLSVTVLNADARLYAEAKRISVSGVLEKNKYGLELLASIQTAEATA